MGNWRTVNIEGTCPPDEVAALRAAIMIEDIMDSSREWLPLCSSNSLCGLGNWGATAIDAGGNLFERGFDVEDVADHLRKLLEVAPGLAVKVHCGGDWEADECVATVTAQDGTVTVSEPERPTVTGVSADESMIRLMGAMFRG